MPKISVIIPLHNQAELTLKCLQSLSANTDYPDWELILVDNASTDGTPDLLKSLEGDVKVIRNETNLGFAKANNQGAKIADGELLCFLNNDTEVQPGWLSALADCLQKNPGSAAVGGKLLFPDGTIQHAGLVFDKIDKIAYHIYRGLPADIPCVNKPRRLKAVTAACMLVKKEFFTAAGMFDENYINGYEDIDLCLKIGQLKGEIYYTPACRVVHHTSATPGRKDNEEHNYRYFQSQWVNKITSDEDAFLAQDGYRAEWKGLSMTLREIHCEIIIPAFNNLEYTRRCLDSIRKNTEYPFYKITVVDNGSTDGTPGFLQNYPGVHFIRNEQNLGFAHACNQAASASTSDILVFLNNDTEVQPGWLTRLVETLSDPAVGAAGGKLLYPDGTIQHAGVVFDKIDKIGYHIYNGHPGNSFYANKTRDFCAVTGACLAVQRELFEKVGGFDESYINGREDIDLCMKIGQSGYIIRYNPLSVVIHYEEKTPGRKLHDADNIRRFLQKWETVLTSDEDYYYQQDGFKINWTSRNRYDLNYTGDKACILIAPSDRCNIVAVIKNIMENTAFPDYKIYVKMGAEFVFPHALEGIIGKIYGSIEQISSLPEQIKIVIPSDLLPPKNWLDALYLWGQANGTGTLISNGRPTFGKGYPSFAENIVQKIIHFSMFSGA